MQDSRQEVLVAQAEEHVINLIKLQELEHQDKEIVADTETLDTGQEAAEAQVQLVNILAMLLQTQQELVEQDYHLQ